jgi:hypothetical protein
MTKRDASAIHAYIEELCQNPEFEEMIRQTPYYKMGKKDGLNEARAEGQFADRLLIEKGMRQKGMSNDEIKAFLAYVMQLSEAEIMAVLTHVNGTQQS